MARKVNRMRKKIPQMRHWTARYTSEYQCALYIYRITNSDRGKIIVSLKLTQLTSRRRSNKTFWFETMAKQKFNSCQDVNIADALTTVQYVILSVFAGADCRINFTDTKIWKFSTYDNGVTGSIIYVHSHKNYQTAQKDQQYVNIQCVHHID